MPESPLGVAWRLADILREFRGDVHIAAWTGAGFDAPEIGLLTELYWGLPRRSYIRTRAWSREELDAADERLRERGLVTADGEALSEAGRTAREAVELHTDRLCGPIARRLSDDIEELIAILLPWGAEVRAAGGYPGPGLDLRPDPERRPAEVPGSVATDGARGLEPSTGVDRADVDRRFRRLERRR